MPVDVSEVHARTVAQCLALTHAFHDENGRADLRLLVQRLNGTVVTGRPQLTVGDDGAFTISTLRGSRYETAHFLGHYVLGFLVAGRSNPALVRCPTTISGERVANLFADEILMPPQFFHDSVAAHRNDMRSIAEQFGVTPLTARMRSHRLRTGAGIASVR